MDLRKQNIDELFAKKLGKAEFEHSPFAWDKVQANLEAKGGTNKSLAYLYWSAAAAVVVSVSVGVMLWKNNNPYKAPTQELATITVSGNEGTASVKPDSLGNTNSQPAGNVKTKEKKAAKFTKDFNPKVRMGLLASNEPVKEQANDSQIKVYPIINPLFNGADVNKEEVKTTEVAQSQPTTTPQPTEIKVVEPANAAQEQGNLANVVAPSKNDEENEFMKLGVQIRRTPEALLSALKETPATVRSIAKPLGNRISNAYQALIKAKKGESNLAAKKQNKFMAVLSNDHPELDGAEDEETVESTETTETKK
jgi:hypothetical protein